MVEKKRVNVQGELANKTDFTLIETWEWLWNATGKFM